MLILQPGSEFVSTQSGFDTGKREFICATSAAQRLEPQIRQCDTDIRFLKNGALTRGGYPWMFVSSVSAKEEVLGRTRITVQYIGMKRRLSSFVAKKEYREPGYENQSLTLPGGISINLSVPTFRRVYLTNGQKPLTPINTPIPELEKYKPDLTYAGITIPDPLYDGWRVRSQNLRLAGISDAELSFTGTRFASTTARRVLVEVTETISYQIVFE